MAPPDRTKSASPEWAPSSAFFAIERERFAAYSSLMRNLHWLAAVLVLLYSVLTPNANRLGLWGLAALVTFYTLILHSRLLWRLSLGVRVWLEAALDLTWITAVLVVTEGAHSPFFFLFTIVLYAGNPSTTRGPLYGKAALATALILGVLVPIEVRLHPTTAWGEAAGDLTWPIVGIWLMAYFFAETGALRASVHRSLYLAAHTDELTGLPNLRFFTGAADLRNTLGAPYSIVMVDADNLKGVNDRYGHAAGSELLKTIADAIRSAARGDDLCSRVGGDEFIVRLAGTSDNGALSYCRRVRSYLREHPLRVTDTNEGETEVAVTISTGIAAFPQDGKTLSEVTQRADAALYRSKQGGKALDSLWADGTASL